MPITVYNETSLTLRVFVTSWATKGGSDKWFDLGAHAQANWNRTGGWELVAFANKSNPMERIGAYVPVCPITKVEFHGFNEGDVKVQK